MKKNVIHLIILWLSFFTTQSLAVNKVPNPILVIGGSSNFGSYIGEILRAEGMNEFQIEKSSDARITLSYLKNFDVVILSEMSISKAQKNLYTRFVNEGGNLIALRPDKKLSALFGLTNATGTIENGYIGIETTNEIGVGLITNTLQLHCSADRYNLVTATKIATLYADAATSTNFPGVTFNNYGKGHAIAFTYNLSKNIVLTRQGNPQFAGQEKDGITGIRAADMFVGWIDTAKCAINQADEQMRILLHSIEKLSSYKKPLPRTWYFPDTAKCVTMITDDGEDSPASDIDSEIQLVQSKGGHMSVYLRVLQVDYPASTVTGWLNNGHDISCHFDDTDEATNPTWAGMDNVVSTTLSSFISNYGVTPTTVRNHWIVWCGKNSSGGQEFAAQAQIEANHGLGFDCNYYHYTQGSAVGDFLGGPGNFTGSGLLMKFAASTGSVLNIYQSVTQIPDEMWFNDIYNNAKTIIDRSMDSEGYTYLNCNFHTDRMGVNTPTCREQLSSLLDYCNTRGIPIWSAKQGFDFIKMRDEAKFSNISWSNNKLSFKINSSLTNDNGLTFMIPQLYCGKKIDKIMKDGVAASFNIKSVKGRQYAFITIKSGSNYNFTINYIN